MNYEKIYLHSPVIAQNIFCSLYGIGLIKRRYNKEYKNKEKEIFKHDSFSNQQLTEFSLKRLQAILEHSYKTVPFYRDWFDKNKFDIKSIKTSKDISVLPILNKGIVQNNINGFKSSLLKRIKYSVIHTSGTTGAGLIFPFSLEAEQEQWAIWWRYRNRFGIDCNTWYGHFYGKTIVPHLQDKPPFWRINYPGKQILFSGYHMNEENLPYYIEELDRRQPLWIQGYPSLLAVIAHFIIDKNISLEYQPRIITTGAESLLSQQKTIIEKAFGAPCRQHYGMAEGVANISECPEGNLHVDEDYSLVEFIPINEYQYKIVGTTYTNYAFPLIRYDTGDIAELEDPGKRCKCGRPGRLVKSIDGRIEDYVITPDGNKIGRMDHIFKDMINIKECQVFQESKEEVVFRIVRGEKYSIKDEDILLNEAHKRLGNLIKIRLEYISTIERTARGKLRFVISKLPEAKIIN